MAWFGISPCLKPEERPPQRLWQEANRELIWKERGVFEFWEIVEKRKKRDKRQGQRPEAAKGGEKDKWATKERGERRGGRGGKRS